MITTFNRAHLLRPTLSSFSKQEFKDYEVIVVDDGNDNETPLLCAEPWPFSLKYHRMNRQRNLGYNNPARPMNVGIRMAQGEVIILQNAEVKHGSGEVIESLANLCGTNTAVFAQVAELNEDGTWNNWYCHADSPRPLFFCGALRREWFEKLRGFDEEYQYYGYEDADLSDRLTAAGVTFFYSDVEAQHQWHPLSHDHTDPNNSIPKLTYERKTQEMKDGKIGIERNLGWEWGQT